MFARPIVLLSAIPWVTAFVVPTTHLRSTTITAWAKPKVFIDGEAGTTGLQVRDRLGKRTDIEIISAPDHLRKDEATRKQLLNEADAVILCTFVCVFMLSDCLWFGMKSQLTYSTFLILFQHRPPRRRLGGSGRLGGKRPHCPH